ncbi:hypothetical protein FHT32_004752 [Variovorax sp. SG517]|uniref:hypothetical protein n=1 Tax=Variovorax sp. SG517 TaxID=2587117 RepID=UPI00159D7A5E|nr:hypothetical protein [Variovorax sp. SG517]NVM91088.1 hypothetical protein [Variovorax sp. SG517]
MTDNNLPPLPPIGQDVLYARVVAQFGGPDGLMRHVQARHAEFQSVWGQDSVELGQVLHAHLVVEFFLTEYLKHLFPGLDMDKLGLRYGQKVRMLPTDRSMLSAMVPGLNALGTIRNRLAHVRRVQISKDDVQAIVNVDPYTTLVGFSGSIDLAVATPLEIVLSFAQWAAGSLHSASDPTHERWAFAADPTRAVPGYEHFLPDAPFEGVPGVGRRPGLTG